MTNRVPRSEEGVGRGGRKVYFGTLATRLTLAARLIWRAATRLMAGRYAAQVSDTRPKLFYETQVFSVKLVVKIRVCAREKLPVPRARPSDRRHITLGTSSRHAFARTHARTVTPHRPAIPDAPP